MTDPVHVLASLTVADEMLTPSYDRKAFGQRWKDIDHNGCGQRDDVLARDLREVQKRNECVVTSGTLDDPYTGRTIAFTKARASEVQIDHVVPLAASWRSGAAAWSPEERERFANDTSNLLAVDGRVNMSKGDKTPEDWMPANRASACRYTAIYVITKASYRLTVTTAEKESLRFTLTHAC